jgi:hypothetical protein
MTGGELRAVWGYYMVKNPLIGKNRCWHFRQPAPSVAVLRIMVSFE